MISRLASYTVLALGLWFTVSPFLLDREIKKRIKVLQVVLGFMILCAQGLQRGAEEHEKKIFASKIEFFESKLTKIQTLQEEYLAALPQVSVSKTLPRNYRASKDIGNTVKPPSIDSEAIVQPTLNNIRVYPVPWQPNSGGKFDSANVLGCGTGLVFDNLTREGTIRIYTIPGDLIREIPFSAANNGCQSWDGKDAAGRNVTSGIYIALIKDVSVDGGSSIKKLAIER